MPKISKRIIITIALLSGLLLAGVGAVIGVSWWKSRNQQSSADTALETLAQISEYPEAYEQAGLPKYPNAEVTYLGNGDDTSKDGVFIYLNTQDGIEIVSDFFDKELTANGWHLPDNRKSSTDGLITRTYLKDNQEFSLIFARDETTKQSNITINWQNV